MSINIGVNIQRSPNRINQALRAAGVNGQYPKLLFDFDDEYYLTNGSSKTFANAMTFARAGNATMVDSDGLIKWAPHNIFTYSEDFSNAVWVDINGTLAVNSFTASNDNNAHYFYQDIATISPTDHTVSFEIKAYADAQYFQIAFGVSDVSGNPFVNFDLLSGTITADANSVGTIVDVGDGWYRCEVSVVSAVSSSFAVVGVAIGSSSATRLQAVDASALNLNYGIRRAHLYRSDLGGMVNNPDRGDSYVPTTSSAVYLPRRGHHKYNGDQWVNKGILAESEARTNVVTYSDQFNNAAWTKAAPTITADAIASPDGNDNADKLVESSTTAHAVYQVPTVTAVAYTFSVFAKSAERTQVNLDFTGGTNGAYFNLSTGEVISSSGTGLTAAITPMGNDWYRCSITQVQSAGAIYPSVSTSVGGARVYLGDGSSGIYIYGAQLEAGSTPSSYIPTNGSTVTRAAETVTVPYGNLPWPTPTYIGDELVTNGTFDTDSNWIQHTTWNIAGGVATHSATSGGGLSQSWTPTAGSVYEITFTVSGATSGDFYYAFSSASGLVADQIKAPNRSSNGTYKEYLVADGTTVYHGVWGTSTFDGSVDNISIREINPLSVSIAMMGEMNYADNDETQAHFFFLWESDSNNRIRTWLDTSSTSTGHLDFNQTSSGVVDIVSSSNSIYSPDLNVPFNIAGRHGSTFINGAVDGIALTADTTPVSLPDLSTTNLQLAFNYNGTISEFRMWDKDIQDSGIAEATKPSTEPSLSLTFDGQPSSFTNSGLTS